MGAIYNAVNAFVNWAWGIPLLVVLVAGGIILTVINKGVQFLRLPTVFRTTVKTLFDREEQARKKAAGVSPFQALTAALGATVGTGNIVGVGTAIALGGPGAMFWMWVCGFVAMAIKYSEVTLSIIYREKREDGEYRGGPFMYMKNGLKCKPVAYIFGISMVTTMAFICCVHSSSITSNLASIGVNKWITCVVMVAFMLAILLGGMKNLVKISDKLVPIMSGVYIIFCLIVIFANIGNIGTVLAEIFHDAFTGHAAFGGFAGATFAAAMRWGLSRGVFSNDAGLGLSASVQAQAEAIDHPAQQGSWAIIETFIDTIIICTVTGFAILFTGVWTADGETATLASRALASVLGPVGLYGTVISLGLFGLSSLITDLEGAGLNATAMFGSVKIGRFFQALVIAMVVLGTFVDISSAFVLADFGNAIILFVNIPCMILLGKELRKYTNEWFDNDGDLEKIAKLRGSADK